MKSVFLQPTVIVASLFILVLVGGGVYGGIRIYSNARDKDALVERAQQLATGHASAEQIAAELIKARETSRAEGQRLNLFVNYPSSPDALAAVREEIYENVFNVLIPKTEAILTNIETSKMASAMPQAILKSKIETDQKHVRVILAEWQNLIGNPISNSNPATAIQVAQYATEVKAYVQELQQLVQQLTPDNSGLTPTEIVAEVEGINEIVAEREQAILDLSQTTVPPAVVNQQQEVLNDAQNQVNELEQELEDVTNPPDTQVSNQNPIIPPISGQGNEIPISDSGTLPTDSNQTPSSQTSSQNLPGTPYIPPVPYIDPSKPKLIEGANTELVD